MKEAHCVSRSEPSPPTDPPRTPLWRHRDRCPDTAHRMWRCERRYANRCDESTNHERSDGTCDHRNADRRGECRLPGAGQSQESGGEDFEEIALVPSRLQPLCLDTDLCRLLRFESVERHMP